MQKLPLLVLSILLGHITMGQERLSLQQAIDYAIKHHNQLKQNELDYRTAEQTIKEFRSIGMPKINGNVDYSYYMAVPAQPVADFITPSVYGVLFQENVIPERQLGPPETFEFSFVQPNVLTGSIAANMLIFDGSYLYGLKAAKLYRELVNKERDQTIQSITNNVTKAYMAVLIVEKNKEVVSQNIQVLEKSLADTRAVYDSGFAESLDVDRLQLSLENLKTEISNLDQIIQLSYNLLKFQMNYPIDQQIVVADDLESMVNEVTVEELTLDSEINMSNRAEFAVISTGQKLNELDLKRNKAGYLPSASAFVSAQQSLQRNNLFDNNEVGWLPTAVIGVNIKVPIYDGGEKSAKIEQVKLKMAKTDLQKQDLERAITLEVRNAQLSIINARNTVQSRKRSLDLAQKIYDKSRIKFTEGVGSSIEVSQAEGDLYQAQANYINALYDLLTAKTELNIALAK